ncbi:hypothetical protein ACWCPF_02225 [Streptomyces sp. NPDC001858]
MQLTRAEVINFRAPLTDVILDLDDDCFTVKIQAALGAPRPHDFLKDFWTASQRQKFDPHQVAA